MRALLLAVALIACFSFEAHASSSFGYSGQPFGVQFVGREFTPDCLCVVEVSGKTGPRSLPEQSYKLSNYQFGQSFRLEFSNNGDSSLPPSFVLVVSGTTAKLETVGQTFVGSFTWDS